MNTRLRNFADKWIYPLATGFLLWFIGCLGSGCVSRSMTRFDGEGKPWSKERLTLFMVRGEASKLREQIKETKAGDYTRDVFIGEVKGETETDKLKDLLGEVAERAAKGAVGKP